MLDLGWGAISYERGTPVVCSGSQELVLGRAREGGIHRRFKRLQTREQVDYLRTLVHLVIYDSG